jgi:Retrotransposon gag protein/Zinc knuckle
MSEFEQDLLEEVPVLEQAPGPTMQELQDQITALQTTLNNLRASSSLPKPPKPSSYNGGKGARQWLFKMQNYFHLAGIHTDTDKILYVGSYLEGAASDWWRYKMQLLQANPVPYTWVNFQFDLLARFQPLAEDDVARQKLRRLRQRDYIRAYVQVFNETVLQIQNMDEGTKVDNFLFGLRPDSRRWVRLQKPTTLEAAMTRAEEYEAMELQDKANDQALHKRVQERQKPRNDSFRQSTGPEPMQLGATNGNTSRSSEKDSSQNRSVRTCFKCGKPGHIARECRSRKTAPPAKNAHVRTHVHEASDSEEN